MKAMVRVHLGTLLVGASIAISGCAAQTDARSLYLVDHRTGAVGTSNFTTVAHQTSGQMDIALNGKTYIGSWVYSPQGGSRVRNFGTAFDSNGQAVAGLSTTVVRPSGGPGSILATASDGSTLRCAFEFSEAGQNGRGECQDNAGGNYDLQIR